MVALARRRRACPSMRTHYVSGLRAHQKQFKMALCATGSFMLGEVTAPKCFYQAKIFYELNLPKFELLQDVFAFSLQEALWPNLHFLKISLHPEPSAPLRCATAKSCSRVGGGRGMSAKSGQPPIHPLPAQILSDQRLPDQTDRRKEAEPCGTPHQSWRGQPRHQILREWERPDTAELKQEGPYPAGNEKKEKTENNEKKRIKTKKMKTLKKLKNEKKQNNEKQ